jgi:DNA-binding MarR family transcriptional regulator
MPEKLAKTKVRRLPPLLRRAWYGLNQAFRQRIAHLEITPDQFSILRWIEESDARVVTQRELVGLLASDANTIASTLRRMEKAGLVDRDVHKEDRRANRVRLKPAGKKKFAAAQKIASAVQGEVLSSLPESRREKFLAELELVADACQNIVAVKKSAKREI